MGDPGDLSVLDGLRFLTGKSIEPVVSSEQSIRRAIERSRRAPSEFPS